MRLVDLLVSLHGADSAGAWSALTKRKRKKSKPGGPSQEPPSLSVQQALIKMVNDSDHTMRMRVAQAVASLFLSTGKESAHTSRASDLPLPCDEGRVSLSRAHQENIFQQVLGALQLAFVISDGLDELSTEDESVNRVASRIYTLLICGCVSPVCERKIVGELVMAAGCGHIDRDLVAKVT